MLSMEDTALLSEVGADKPMGQMLRRFWMPVLLSEELPAPDCTPVAVRIMGEDLVAFRDTSGKVGLTSAYCPHRHAHLFWGRNEDCGLRCTYHGWKFDVDGNCVDMPNEPAETNFKEKIQLASYPTREAGGCIWAYMGPAEKMPSDIPALEWTRVPANQLHVTKRLQENNWAQAVEGGIDSSHISYLHNDSLNLPQTGLTIADRSPRMFVEPRDHGFIEAARRKTVDGHNYWRIRPFLVPSGIIIPGGRESGGLNGHIWVPVDDHHVWVYTISWLTNRPFTTEEIEVLSPVSPPMLRWTRM
jgi:phthalate 4,5-dioxygenase